MIRRILLRSVGITTSTDGQPPTDLISERTSQPSDELLAMLAERYPEYTFIEPGSWTWRWRQLKSEVYVALARGKHLVGLHTPVEVEDWSNNSIKFVGTECWVCSVRMS